MYEASLDIRQIHIETTMTYHYTHRMAKEKTNNKNPDIGSAGEDL